MSKEVNSDSQELSCPRCNSSNVGYIALDAYQHDNSRDDGKGLSMFIRDTEFDYSYGYFGKKAPSESTVVLSGVCAECSEILSFTIKVNSSGKAIFTLDALGKFNSENPNAIVLA